MNVVFFCGEMMESLTMPCPPRQGERVLWQGKGYKVLAVEWVIGGKKPYTAIYLEEA